MNNNCNGRKEKRRFLTTLIQIILFPPPRTVTESELLIKYFNLRNGNGINFFKVRNFETFLQHTQASQMAITFILIFSFCFQTLPSQALTDWERSVAMKSLHRAFGVKYDANYRVQISTKLVTYVLCGDQGCVDRPLKEELMKCLSKEMIDSWFECVRKTDAKAKYTDCDGTNYKKMLECNLLAVSKDPLIAPHNLMDCYENVVNIFAYKCSVVNRFYESVGITLKGGVKETDSNSIEADANEV